MYNIQNVGRWIALLTSILRVGIAANVCIFLAVVSVRLADVVISFAQSRWNFKDRSVSFHNKVKNCC